MELKDTINLMTSSDYKDRFIAEYCQTVIRYLNLKSMFEKFKNKTLEFELSCPISTYHMQVRAMADYIATLEARAVMENIDLPNLAI